MDWQLIREFAVFAAIMVGAVGGICFLARFFFWQHETDERIAELESIVDNWLDEEEQKELKKEPTSHDDRTA